MRGAGVKGGGPGGGSPAFAPSGFGVACPPGRRPRPRACHVVARSAWTGAVLQRGAFNRAKDGETRPEGRRLYP